MKFLREAGVVSDINKYVQHGKLVQLVIMKRAFEVSAFMT